MYTQKRGYAKSKGAQERCVERIQTTVDRTKIKGHFEIKEREKE